ncbi:hypothetical protein GJAV_G00215170 [Gymnothorax javanicus]|nr:hypothetical protein GJAV_G00215170 [Gymnothorax javanicus]
MRELVWKHAKDSDYLKDNKLKFGEDLTFKDKEARNKLWPLIAEAHKQGKKAYYVGAKAIIDGKECGPWRREQDQTRTQEIRLSPHTGSKHSAQRAVSV